LETGIYAMNADWINKVEASVDVVMQNMNKPGSRGLCPATA